MAGIINDLLVAARRDPSRIVIDLTSIDLADEIANVLPLWPQAAIRTAVPASGLRVLADEVRIRQILSNLIGNSVRYGGETIEVHVAIGDDTVTLQVRDDGAGIPSGEWEWVFDPYETAHRDAAQPASVGLGLTVSRILARRMNGDLTYRFENGHSVFELTLPRAREAVRAVV